jgi:hypothetical protein
MRVEGTHSLQCPLEIQRREIGTDTHPKRNRNLARREGLKRLVIEFQYPPGMLNQDMAIRRQLNWPTF